MNSIWFVSTSKNNYEKTDPKLKHRAQMGETTLIDFVKSSFFQNNSAYTGPEHKKKRVA